MLKTAAILLLAIPLLAAPGFAQTNPPPTSTSAKVKFIDMSEMVLTGEGIKVPAMYVSVDERAKFDRLVNLKRSVLPKMKATAKDVSLR